MSTVVINLTLCMSTVVINLTKFAKLFVFTVYHIVVLQGNRMVGSWFKMSHKTYMLTFCVNISTI